jgi:hypothetical protein
VVALGHRPLADRLTVAARSKAAPRLFAVHYAVAEMALYRLTGSYCNLDIPGSTRYEVMGAAHGDTPPCDGRRR